MSRLGPALDARASFRITRSALFELLSQFDAADWTSVTAAAPWTVHDVVAHLLGDDVLRLSRSRDAHWLAPELGLPASLHRANAQWVAAFQSVSPQVLVDLLHVSSQEIAGYWDSVNLDEIGEAVSWSGPGPAPVWFDCARDFSEDWVHQAQIREATGRPPWGRDDVRAQLIDTVIRAIPHTLNRHALSGESLRVDVVDLGRSWSWQREADGWSYAPYQQSADAVVRIDSDTLWHVAVRMIQPVDAVKHARIEGDTPLARAALHLLSIIR
jgi:uncharacterized protein (TIGR03083 family)